jgi:hypothetical protein
MTRHPVRPGSFHDYWQQSIDVLERQDIATIAASSRKGNWRSAWRYVLWASLLIAAISAVDGLLDGFSPLRVLLLEIVRLLSAFTLLVYGIHTAGRLLGGKGRAGQMAYAVALFYVPLELWRGLLTLLLSLLPFWPGSILTVASLVLVWAFEITLGYRTVLACLEFDRHWKAVLAILFGGLLALLAQGLLFTS